MWGFLIKLRTKIPGRRFCKASTFASENIFESPVTVPPVIFVRISPRTLTVNGGYFWGFAQ